MKRIQRWHLVAVTLLLFASVGGIVILREQPSRANGAAPATRDPFIQPFDSTSIWNMPIGSGAKYVNATIGSRGFSTDTDWFIVTKASDPKVPTYMPPTFTQGRCSGTTPQQQAQWHPEAAGPINVPSNLIIADATANPYSTPNNTSAFLAPDGRTLINYNVTARCQAGGPLYGNWFGQTDLYGDGIDGGHGGSGMSSIGGDIRTGELLNNAPITHALKVNLWGNWLYYSASTGGNRWPARLADGGAPNQYKGSNPALKMGSLLALPPNATPESLGLTSTIGKKVFQALQNYGAYVVDDTGGDDNALDVEQQAQVEFKNATGHSIDQDAGLISDFNKMIANVQVIDNNSPTSIGGGGTPRVPLAPPLGAPGSGSATPTATPPSTSPSPTAPVSPTPTQNPVPTPTQNPVPTATPVGSNPTGLNNVGVSNDSNTTSANFDGGQRSYSAQALLQAGLTPGKVFTFNGVSFSFPTLASGKPDNYQVAQRSGLFYELPRTSLNLPNASSIADLGPRISVSAVPGATTVAFLGGADNALRRGSQGIGVLVYADGTKQPFLLCESDWTLEGGKVASTCNNQPALTMPYRNTSQGREYVKTYLFYVAIPLMKGKTLKSVMLPSFDTQGRIHVFAVGTK